MMEFQLCAFVLSLACLVVRNSAVVVNCQWESSYSVSDNAVLTSVSKNPDVPIENKTLENNVNCRTVINMDLHYEWVKLVFRRFDLKGNNTCSNGSESLTITSLNYTTDKGAISFCGKRGAAFLVRKKSIVLEYNSGMFGQGQGFSLLFFGLTISNPCLKNRYIRPSLDSQLIFSPNYPISYIHLNQVCRLNVYVPHSSVVQLKSLQMDISQDCLRSNLIVARRYTSNGIKFCAGMAADEFITKTFYLTFNSRAFVDKHSGIVLESRRYKIESVFIRSNYSRHIVMEKNNTLQIYNISFDIQMVSHSSYRYEALIDSGDDNQVLELEWITKTIGSSAPYLSVEIKPVEQDIRINSDKDNVPFHSISSQSRSILLTFSYNPYNSTQQRNYSKGLLLAVKKHVRDQLPVRLISRKEASYLYVSPGMLASASNQPDIFRDLHIFTDILQSQIYLQDVTPGHIKATDHTQATDHIFSTSLSSNFHVYNGDNPLVDFDMTYTCLGHELNSSILYSVNTNIITLRIRPEHKSSTGRLLKIWTKIVYTEMDMHVSNLYPLEIVTLEYTNNVSEFLQSTNANRRNAFCWLQVRFTGEWLKIKLNKQKAPENVVQIRLGTPAQTRGFDRLVRDDTNVMYTDLTMAGDSERWMYFQNNFNILYLEGGNKLSFNSSGGIFLYKTYEREDEKDIIEGCPETIYKNLSLANGDNETWSTLNYPDFLPSNTVNKYSFRFPEGKALVIEFSDLSNVKCDVNLIQVEYFNPITGQYSKIDVCRDKTEDGYRATFPESLVTVIITTRDRPLCRGIKFNTYPSTSGSGWFGKCNTSIALAPGTSFTLTESIAPNIYGFFKCVYTIITPSPYVTKVQTQKTVGDLNVRTGRTNNIKIYSGKTGQDFNYTSLYVEVDVNCRTENTLGFELVFYSVLNDACNHNVKCRLIKNEHSYRINSSEFTSSLLPQYFMWYFMYSDDLYSNNDDSRKPFIKISISTLYLHANHTKLCSGSRLQFFASQFMKQSISSQACGKMNNKEFFVDGKEVSIFYNYGKFSPRDYFILSVSRIMKPFYFKQSGWNSLYSDDTEAHQYSKHSMVIGLSIGAVVLIVVIISVVVRVNRTKRLARRQRANQTNTQNISLRVDRRLNVFFFHPITINSDNDNEGEGNDSTMSPPPYPGLSD